MQLLQLSWQLVTLTLDGPSKGGKDWRAGRAASANIMAINDPFMTPSYMEYLLKYDTAHGVFKHNITLKEKENLMLIDDKKIRLSFEIDPSKVAWNKKGVDNVAICSEAITN